MAQAPTLWNNGRPQNVVGMSRDNAPSKMVDPGLVARIANGVRSWLNMDQQNGSPELPFFPPGKPLDPVAPGVAGRQFDYPTNYNATIRPRSYEPIDYETLRALAEPGLGGWDLVRLAIETRKDQMEKLTFSILPRKPANAQIRPKSTPNCEQIESFLRRPDGVHPWSTWVRMLIEEQLVVDCATIYKHETVGGDLAKLEIIDGTLIKPILSYDGRRPGSGEPAYTQVLKGLPAVNYTPDQLIYAPRNPRAHKVYGYSCVEQVLITINIGLRRQVSQLGYFTEGSVPDAVAAVPPDWSRQQIKEFQDYWDSIVNDAVNRRKLKFIPGGVAFQQTRNDNGLVDAFDEWLARVIQYCFSLPPTPLVKAVNRATAESAYDTAIDEGLQPLMTWVKSIIDDIIVRWFGQPDLEMVWDDVKKTDPAAKEERDMPMVDKGIISRDDMRADRGLEPLGIPPVVQGIGPLGFMSIASMIKAIDNGWDLTGMPQPVMPGAEPGMPGGVGGPTDELAGMDADLLGTGQPGDPLNGLPPGVLEALGVSSPKTNGLELRRESNADNAPPGALGDPQDATSPGVIPIHKHPVVQAALRDGERHAKRIAARMNRAGR